MCARAKNSDSGQRCDTSQHTFLTLDDGHRDTEGARRSRSLQPDIAAADHH
jgi:hypothetical protein